MIRRPKGLGRFGLTLGWLLCLGCNGADGGGRAEAIKAAGALLGMGFSQELPPSLDEAFRSMPSVRLRDRNFFTNVLTGEDVLVFDWTWRVGRIKDRTRVKQTLIAVRRSRADLPGFVWAERGSISASDLRAFGGALDFDGARAFSDRFDVAGQDRGRIRAIFSEERRAAMALPAGLQLEGQGDWLIVYRPGKMIVPDTLERELRDARAVVRRLE